jgi:signal transduction histidine kinase
VVAALVVSAQMSIWTSDALGLEGGRTVHAFLLALITVPLLVRRRWPLVVLLVVTMAATLQYQLGGDVFQPWFAILLALYAVAAHAELTAAAAGAGVVAVLVLAIDVPRLLKAGEPVGDVVPAWFFLGGVWAFGRWMRHRRRITDELLARTEAAERDRAEQAALAVAEERARIAHELHDLVAHSMSVIVIQSQAGQRSLPRDPAAAGRALCAIETTARQGVGELRRLLELLTSEGGADVSPQPRLKDLDDLVSKVRSAGLRVDVHVFGELGGLSAGVDLAAYRIVQEALTNVLKHASASTARVALRVEGTCLDIEVIDDGRGEEKERDGGHGLVGMRERATLYGGEVVAHGLPGQGFRVHARLGIGAGAA